jgi:hypothetical protein
MLTETSTEQDFPRAREYRSVANMVHTQLLDVLDNDPPRLPKNARNSRRVVALQRMLNLGRRYAPAPGGQLDSTRSTAGTLDLAKELVQLTPKRLPEFSSAENFDMKAWVNHAERVLDAVARGERPAREDVEFARQELAPFLYNLLTLPTEESDE